MYDRKKASAGTGLKFHLPEKEKPNAVHRMTHVIKY